MDVIVVSLIFDYLAAQLFELVAVIMPCVCSADQELEACAEWLSERTVCMGDQLRSARRPKPSLKEQALALLDKAEDPSWDINDFSILRQALEALPND